MAGMAENTRTLMGRLGRALGLRSKTTRATEQLAARDQAREIEEVAKHAPGYSEDEAEHGGHHYLRP
jgi:hypothetical protein